MKNIYHIVFSKLKNKNSTFILVLLLGFNCACKKTNSQNFILERLIIDNGKSIGLNYSGYLLLIPNDGCHPCIQKAIKLASKNLNRKNIYFVITSDFDFKSTKLKFSNKELLSRNLVFDERKRSNQLGLHKSYLTIFYFNEGGKISERTINPSDASFELVKLQSLINDLK